MASIHNLPPAGQTFPHQQPMRLSNCPEGPFYKAEDSSQSIKIKSFGSIETTNKGTSEVASFCDAAMFSLGTGLRPPFYFT